jgi:hypothetical protein
MTTVDSWLATALVVAVCRVTLGLNAAAVGN